MSEFRPNAPYLGSQVIHCVSWWQHFVDACGRTPRARCGVKLCQRQSSSLYADGAPLCPACAAVTHPPSDQVALFNGRGHHYQSCRAGQ